MFQETVAWRGNFAFLLATKYRTQMPKQGFDGTFSQKEGGFSIKKLNILPLPL